MFVVYTYKNIISVKVNELVNSVQFKSNFAHTQFYHLAYWSLCGITICDTTEAENALVQFVSIVRV